MTAVVVINEQSRLVGAYIRAARKAQQIPTGAQRAPTIILFPSSQQREEPRGPRITFAQRNP